MTPWINVPTSVPPGIAANANGTERNRVSSGSSAERAPASNREGVPDVSSSKVTSASGSLAMVGCSCAALVMDEYEERRQFVSSSRSKAPTSSSEGLSRWWYHRMSGGWRDALHHDLRSQRAERRDDSLVRLRALADCRDLAVGPAVEEKARERGVLRVLCSSPPEHRLVAGAGEGDIEQAQALTLLLCLLQFLVGRQAGARTPDVDGPLVRAVRVVKDRDIDRKRPAVPGVRDHHDRELQSLASVDRDHLHRLRVRLQAPSPLFVLAVPVCLQDAPPQPVGEGRRAHTLGDGRIVQQLGDMTQVRHEAFPRRAASTRAGTSRAVVTDS